MWRVAVAALVASSAFAQTKFVYPLPAADTIQIRKDVAYKPGLLMDVYRPARETSALPVVIFLNTGSSSQRTWPQYTGWAAAVAGEGFIGINPDSQPDRVEENFDALLDYVRAHAAELHVNVDQVAVWACSGHVGKSFALVEDPKRAALKSAVFYYGFGPVPQWRVDLPVFYARAGLDRPGMNRGIDELAAAGIAANAPIELRNYPGGHHGFDVVDDNDASREVIAATLRFLKVTLDPKYQAAMAAGRAEAEATGAFQRRDFETAARLYAPLAAAHPENGPVQLSYGEALLGAQKYSEALAQIQKARGKAGVGPRDFAIPAAKAAVKAGQPEKAIEFLKTVPPQFLPGQMLRDDPDFRPLAGRAEFDAMAKR